LFGGFVGYFFLMIEYWFSKSALDDLLIAKLEIEWNMVEHSGRK
jgi:hypothetical protein